MSKKNRNRNPVKHTLVDICLLTAGAIDPNIFRECVESIKHEMASVESQFLIFRNGDEPETRKQYDEIIGTSGARVGRSSQDLGFPSGANKAIRLGSSPLVLFISDDVVLHAGALNALVRRMDNPDIGLCGMKLIFPEDSMDKGRPAGRVQHVGHGIDIRGNITHPLLGWSPNHPKCNVTRECSSVTGAAFMVRRSAFNKVNGFFEGYGRGYFEDVDLCFSIRQLGLKVYIDTQAVGTHHTGSTFVKRQQPVPMEVNRMTLIARKGRLMVQDNWTYW